MTPAPSGPFPSLSRLFSILVVLCLLSLLSLVTPKSVKATDYTPDQIRTYVKSTYDLADVSDQILDMGLAKSPLAGNQLFFDIFGYLIDAEKMYADLNHKKYTDAIELLNKDLFKYAIKGTFLGDVLLSPMRVADFSTSLIELSLTSFINQIERNSWDTQIKLYSAARAAGMSHVAIMQGADDYGKGVVFFDGWIFSVGDLRVPPLGQISPTGYTRNQVYDIAQNAYNAAVNSAYFQHDKDTAGTYFKKLIKPGITWSPTISTAPVEISFGVSGEQLSQWDITSYQWDFGDGQTGAGQSIQHYYQQPGSYPVKVTMTESSGPQHEVTDLITIRPPPIDVSYPDGYESLHRHFSTPEPSCVSGHPCVTNYTWNFNDGSPAKTGRTTSQTFDTSGSYTVNLTLTLNDDSTINTSAPVFVGPGTRYIPGHTIYGNETWYSGGTYEVQGDITVAQGATLTIESGVSVKMEAYSKLNVSGTLKATGTTFTSVDGQNQWYGINFYGDGANSSKLENCIVENVSTRTINIANSSPTITGCTLRNNSASSTGIFVTGTNTNPLISNNNIGGGGHGIFVQSYAAPTVTGNTITDYKAFGIIAASPGVYQGNILSGGEFGIHAIYSPNTYISGNNFSNHSTAWLYAQGTITGNEEWKSGSTIYLNGLAVAKGANLIFTGVSTVKMEAYSELSVSGTLKATGTTFTAVDGQNQWYGINFYGDGANSSKLENCIVEKVSTRAINIANSSPTITGCTLRNNSASSTGIFVTGTNTNPLISNNNIGGGGHGIFVQSYAAPTVTGNTIFDNIQYGLYYSGSAPLTATNNNWGAPSGPLDDSDDRASGGLYNPTGKGNRVSDNVNYYPWTGATIAPTATPANFSGVPRQGSINLTWNANKEPSLNGYKLYYGTAPGSYGAPVMLGKVTSYKLTGLTNDTPYYLAISSLNSVGAESARSSEISVTPLNKYALNLTIAGTGDGSVLITQGATACNTTCSTLFEPNTAVTLAATRDQYSLFKGWSGACTATSSNCSLTMTSDKAVTATFDRDTDHCILIDLPTQKYYPSLNAAYLDASSSAIIKAWGTDFTENLLLDRSIAVTIKGGFNAGYTSNAGTTILHGTVTVGKGSLTVEHLTVR